MWLTSYISDYGLNVLSATLFFIGLLYIFRLWTVCIVAFLCVIGLHMNRLLTVFSATMRAIAAAVRDMALVFASFDPLARSTESRTFRFSSARVLHSAPMISWTIVIRCRKLFTEQKKNQQTKNINESNSA